jgi:aspartyl-tRNA synthetase
MLLTNKNSIKEVILFPQMKRSSDLPVEQIESEEE